MTLEDDFRQACKEVDGEVAEYANSTTCNTANGSMTYDHKDSMSRPSVSAHDEVNEDNDHELDASLRNPKSFRSTSTGRSIKAVGRNGGDITLLGGSPEE